MVLYSCSYYYLMLRRGRWEKCLIAVTIVLKEPVYGEDTSPASETHTVALRIENCCSKALMGSSVISNCTSNWSDCCIKSNNRAAMTVSSIWEVVRNEGKISPKMAPPQSSNVAKALSS